TRSSRWSMARSTSRSRASGSTSTPTSRRRAKPRRHSNRCYTGTPPNHRRGFFRNLLLRSGIDGMENRTLLKLLAGAIGFAAGAQVAAKFRRDVRAARNRYGALRRVADTRCGPIEYATVGTGAPLLL